MAGSALTRMAGSNAGFASTLASPSATRAVLERHGFDFKKQLGQNFLINDAIISKILALSEVNDQDVVLEVGTGIGTLTYALLDNAKAVVAIERDEALLPILDDTLFGFEDKLKLVNADALRVSVGDIAFDGVLPNKLVSNLPYAVAATLVLAYFERFGFIQSMTVMVQREVAERMMAAPGNKNYGAYTVKLSMFARPAGSFSVSPNNFMPKPHVESTVLRLDRVDLDVPRDVVDAACTMADAAFFARRKTIANSCKQYFSGRNAKTAEMLPSIFKAAGVDSKTRGEALAPSTYIALGNALLQA